jgi:CMP-N-acetylneuraminic acid synthetase
MYQYRDVFCFIPARGGSKGVPRKNILRISGNPLITHTIKLAKKVKYFDKIFVSTEDNEIKKISLEAGAIVVERPKELATDTTNYLDVIKHFLSSNEIENDPILVLLNAVTPIRNVKDIENCIELYDQDIDCVVSVGEVKIHPAKMFRMKGNLLHFFFDKAPPGNRQDMETLYFANGSVVIASSSFLKNQKESAIGGRMKGYIMDEKHSLDIDTPFDFKICKLLMENSASN